MTTNMTKKYQLTVVERIENGKPVASRYEGTLRNLFDMAEKIVKDDDFHTVAITEKGVRVPFMMSYPSAEDYLKGEIELPNMLREGVLYHADTMGKSVVFNIYDRMD